jgi:hypothetical protein
MAKAEDQEIFGGGIREAGISVERAKGVEEQQK